MTLSKRIDEYKRLKEIHFNCKNQKRLSVEFIYNNKHLLVEQMKISVNELDKYIYTYEYDQFKRLVQIRRNDELLDRYQYDLNSNVNYSKHYKSIEYNQWNQLVQIVTVDNQTLTYKYDRNGFLHWISNEKLFLFNSFGLLVKYKSNRLIIDYIYDSEQRLIIKSYPLTGIYTRFIYGNPLNRRLITHIYNSQMKGLTTIFYDNRNHLIGFEQNERKYVLITDGMGSPLFIYDQQGLLIQENFYGLYGMKLLEKNYQDKVFFPFGHAGLLIDDDLNCAFDNIHGKLYDLVLGRYLVPNFPSAWFNKRTSKPQILDPLQDMNLYQIDSSIYNVNERFFQRLHRNGTYDDRRC
jgi:YD repeat-containing protein